VIDVRESPDGVTFQVRVSPRAAATRIQGEHAGALKVSLTAPPVDDAANGALCAVLAEALCVPRADVQIRHGRRGRLKTVHVAGSCPAAVHGLIGESTAAAPVPRPR
jgi:uncharacterized protein (TIGR00251 family)